MKSKIIISKYITIGLSSIFLLLSLPIKTYASEEIANQQEKNINNKIVNLDKYNLSNKKREEFSDLVNEFNLSAEQQIKLLNDYMRFNYELNANDYEDEIEQTNINNKTVNLDKYNLPKEKKEEFYSLVNEFNLSTEQQIKLLDDYSALNFRINSDKEYTQDKLELSTIEKASRYIVKMVNQNIDKNQIKNWINYVFKYQNNLQNSIEDASIKYFNIIQDNQDLVLKSVIFVIF